MRFMNFVSILTFCLLFGILETSAQVEYAANANHAPKNLEAKSLVILFTNSISEKKIKRENAFDNENKNSPISASELYDLSAVKEFGSYVNPYSNQMKIVPTDDVEYTKVQLVNNATGLSVLKKLLKTGNNALDITNIEPGSYILIMTDSGRNIFSEEITIL